MAYGTSAMSAARVAALGNDFPALVGDGSQDLTATPRWSAHASGSWAAALVAANTTHPELRAVDLSADSYTTPSAGLTGIMWLLFDWSADPIAELEMVALQYHNFGTLIDGAPITSVQVHFQIADDSAFTVNLLTVASWTLSTQDDNTRLCDVALGGGNNIYTDVPYGRIKITQIGGAPTTLPYLGEAWWGKMRIMEQGPQHPWAPTHRGGADFDFFGGDGGDVTVYRRFGGRWDQTLSVKFKSDAEAEELRAFWRDCKHGNKGLLIPQPSTAPAAHYICGWPGGLPNPSARNPDHQRYRLQTREAAPFYDTEKHAF